MPFMSRFPINRRHALQTIGAAAAGAARRQGSDRRRLLSRDQVDDDQRVLLDRDRSAPGTGRQRPAVSDGIAGMRPPGASRLSNLEFGIWNLECVPALPSQVTNGKFQIRNSKFFQPRPMYGIFVAITVRNCTFASSGSLDM